jgi:hypothetical protein
LRNRAKLRTARVARFEVSEIGLGKSAEYDIALLRSAVPEPEQEAPAADIGILVLQVAGDALEIAHGKSFPF